MTALSGYPLARIELSPSYQTSSRDHSTNFRVCPDLTTGLIEQASQRLDHPRGASLSDRHPNPHVSEAFEQWDDGTAGDIGTEIQVHPPGDQECSRLWARKVGFSELSDRTERNLAKISKLAQADCSCLLEEDPGGLRGREGVTNSGNSVRQKILNRS